MIQMVYFSESFRGSVSAVSTPSFFDWISLSCVFQDLYSHPWIIPESRLSQRVQNVCTMFAERSPILPTFTNRIGRTVLNFLNQCLTTLQLRVCFLFFLALFFVAAWRLFSSFQSQRFPDISSSLHIREVSKNEVNRSGGPGAGARSRPARRGAWVWSKSTYLAV